MQVTLITEKNETAFAPLLPAPCQDAGYLRIGAVENNTACGVLAAELTEKVLEIQWLFVEPSFRRKGAAHALLETAIELAQKTGTDVICLSCSEQDPPDELTLFLDSESFLSDPDTGSLYVCPLGDLAALKTKLKRPAPKGNYDTLGKIPSFMINEIARHLSKFSGSDYTAGDIRKLFHPDYSIVLKKGGHCGGFLLCSSFEGSLRISCLINLEKENPLAAAHLIRLAYDAIAAENGEDTPVYINAVTEVSVKLIDKLTDGKLRPAGRTVTRYLSVPVYADIAEEV